MKISDMGSMCMGNLFRRKMRTALTIFAVVLGTTMITIMISLGLGMSLAQEEQLKQMGDLTIIDVLNYGRNDKGEKLVLDDEAVAQMQAMEGVVIATPIYNPQRINVSLYAGKKDRYRLPYANIVGMYADAISKMGYELVEGEYLTGSQPNPKKPISVIVGEYASYGFEDTKRKYNNYTWPEKDEQGNVVRDPFLDIMKTDVYMTTKEPQENKGDKDKDKVDVSREIIPVGRIKENWNKGYETSGGVIMEINDLKKLEADYLKANKISVNKKENTGYNRVSVKVGSMDEVDAVETQIKAMGYETRSMETIRKPMQESVRKQQMFLGMMGGITLLVAAVGIMNTMYMSIYERTREIGVMKVLGCVVGNIRSIFLMEAGVIGFLGGCIGVGLSCAISMTMNYFNFSTGLSNPAGGQGGMMMGGMGMMMGGAEQSAAIAVSVVPPWLMLAAIAFATLIGLLSGILPASRATKISALEAIKHE